jgi:hypothetical protein
MRSTSLMHLFAGLLLTTVLAACGGGGGGASTPPVASTPQPPPPPPPPPPPLAYPIPAGLWSAPANGLPASGNYIYLQSDAGDYIGNGRTYLYTGADSLIKMSTSGLAVNATVQGNESWFGGFLLPSGANNLQAGYFAGLTRTPFADKAVGGVEWGGEGRGCNTISGWVVIDKITLTAGAMTALDLRFEQHCEGGTTTLHGQIHWTQADADIAQNPKPSPIPSTLWQPATPITASGSYLYLESRQGDYIGGGRTYLYTPSNASLTVNAAGAHLGVRIAGDENWTGDFQGLLNMNQLTVGYYSGLQRYPFNNPVKGGMAWTGQGYGCNTLNGWFAIDQITYNGTGLASIDLRFEQYCDGSSTPLHGQLHWVANDTSAVPGPLNPPPAGLWTPDPSFVAPSGNYVFLVSQIGDYIGGGKTELFTPDNTTISATTNLTGAFHIAAGGYTGDFYGMNTLSQLQPGYYGGLQRYPFNNPVKGGMDWGGNGRGCNTLTGWFMVDKVTYSMAQMTAIDLRFEQHCEGGAAALHGQIHWVKP